MTLIHEATLKSDGFKFTLLREVFLSFFITVMGILKRLMRYWIYDKIFIKIVDSQFFCVILFLKMVYICFQITAQQATTPSMGPCPVDPVPETTTSPPWGPAPALSVGPNRSPWTRPSPPLSGV